MTSDAAVLRRGTTTAGRLGGLDAARGLAVLGMIVVNVGPTQTENLLQRLYLLPYGRASVLFVVIAGVGMGHFLRRRSGPQLWSTLLWRVALLLLLGLALQSLTDAVSLILQTYAVLFLLAPLLGRLPTPALLGVGLAVLVAGPAWIVHHDASEPRWHAGSGVSFSTPPGEAVHSLVLSGPYPLASWVVPFVAGLLLSRVDLRVLRTQRRLLLWGGLAAVLAFVLAALALVLLGPAADRGWARLLTGVAHGQMPLWLVSSIGGAVFVVAACQRLSEAAPRTVGWLRACGLLAFTLYVLHVLVLGAVKPAEGFSFERGVLVALALNVAAVVLAVGWARTGRPGPLEWLLRNPWLRPASARRPTAGGEGAA